MYDDLALEIFLSSPVTEDMISYLVSATHSVLPCNPTDLPAQTLPSPPASPSRGDQHKLSTPLPSLRAFITNLIYKSNVQTPTLMSTLIYLERLRSKLPPMSRGLACTHHRIFLACLILAAKNLNDSSPKNIHWTAYSLGLFNGNVKEVNLMEKQLLHMLEWNINFTQRELIHVLSPFLQNIKSQLRYANSHGAAVDYKQDRCRYHQYRKYDDSINPHQYSRNRYRNTPTKHQNSHHSYKQLVLETPPSSPPSTSSSISSLSSFSTLSSLSSANSTQNSSQIDSTYRHPRPLPPMPTITKTKHAVSRSNSDSDVMILSPGNKSPQQHSHSTSISRVYNTNTPKNTVSAAVISSSKAGHFSSTKKMWKKHSASLSSAFLKKLWTNSNTLRSIHH